MDPNSFFSDPDPVVLLNVDPDPAAFLMHIRIQLYKFVTNYHIKSRKRKKSSMVNFQI